MGRDSPICEASGRRNFGASYKTGDIAQIHLHHIDARHFDFTVNRASVDDETKIYCQFPVDGAVAKAVAEMTGPDSARWADGKQTLDFALKRDKSGAVTEIDLTGSAATRRYCKDRRALLDDRYSPANSWVPPNQ